MSPCVSRGHGVEDGATTVEYALIAVLVAAVIAAAVGSMGQQLITLFTAASNGLP
jgi:Flp pilus assembly pilin Flp